MSVGEHGQQWRTGRERCDGHRLCSSTRADIRFLCLSASPLPFVQPTVHEYMSRASSIESLLESHGGSGSAGAMGVVGGGSLVGRELEVVLSASDQFESSAHLLQQLQALLPVLDQKWPLEGKREREKQRREQIGTACGYHRERQSIHASRASLVCPVPSL